jgi:hypothetical protein
MKRKVNVCVVYGWLHLAVLPDLHFYLRAVFRRLGYCMQLCPPRVIITTSLPWWHGASPLGQNVMILKDDCPTLPSRHMAFAHVCNLQWSFHCASVSALPILIWINVSFFLDIFLL